MNRGIVLEVHRRFCVVLTPDGSYRKVPGGRHRRVGEEIEFGDASTGPLRRPVWMPAVAAAAVILLQALAVPRAWPFGGPKVAAYVAMDINPSIEFAIAADRDVLKLRALNADGAAVIAGVAYKGKPIEEVTSRIIEKVNDARYLELNDGDIFITSILIDGGISAGFEDEVAAAVDKAVTQTDKASGTAAPVQITHLKAPAELREASISRGVSPGKMAVYLLANKEGASPLELETLKQTSIHNAVKSLGGVQALVGGAAADDDGVKAELKKLLKIEKEAAKANVKETNDAGNEAVRPKTETNIERVERVKDRRGSGNEDRAEENEDKKDGRKGAKKDAVEDDQREDDENNDERGDRGEDDVGDDGDARDRGRDDDHNDGERDSGKRTKGDGSDDGANRTVKSSGPMQQPNQRWINKPLDGKQADNEDDEPGRGDESGGNNDRRPAGKSDSDSKSDGGTRAKGDSTGSGKGGRDGSEEASDGRRDYVSGDKRNNTVNRGDDDEDENKRAGRGNGDSVKRQRDKEDGGQDRLKTGERDERDDD